MRWSDSPGTVSETIRRGRLVRDRLATCAGVDASRVRTVPDLETPHALVLVAPDGSRTILGSFDGMRGQLLTSADLEGIALVAVDPYLGDAAFEAARLAHALGIPVHAIELTPDSRLAPLCDVVLRSGGEGQPDTEARRFLGLGVRTVVVTAGADGCTVFDRDLGVFHQDALSVPVVDATGAGDAFRAGYLFGCRQGWELPRVVRFASAVAALNCTGMSGSERAPTLDQVEHLLQRSE